MAIATIIIGLLIELFQQQPRALPQGVSVGKNARDRDSIRSQSDKRSLGSDRMDDETSKYLV